MYEIIGKITVGLLCCFLVFLFFYVIYKILDKHENKRIARIKRDNDIKNFQNKIIDKDLEKEWVRFLETGQIGRID